MQGHRTALEDNFSPMSSIKPCTGPMGQTVDDIKIGLQVLLHPNLNRYDPYVPPCPFREDLYQRALSGKVNVGYFDSLDTTPTIDAMKRAVYIAKEALERQGFNLIPIKFSNEDLDEAREIFIGLVINYNLGPMIGLLEQNYESPLDCYKMTVMFYKSNFVLRHLIFTLLRLTGNGRVYNAVKSISPLSRGQLDNLHKRQIQLQLKMKQIWSDLGIEAILQPSYISCSFKHENSGDMGVFLDYLNFWSLLLYPVGVVPVGKVELGEDRDYEDGYNDEWTKVVRKDMVGSVGMPISVSVVAEPWQDEIVVGIMKAIDQSVQFKMPPPSSR